MTDVTKRIGVVLCASSMVLSCADDDHGDEAVHTTFAAQMSDAGVLGAPVSDAGAACPEGQVLCGRCMEAFPPTAAAIQQRIFTRSCALSSACHSGNAAQEGLSLASIDETFRSAVDRPSKQRPARALIASGAPSDSYLIDKLRDHQLAASSTRMPPPPSEPLCEAKIRAIEAWIAAGPLR